jgi:hypothetical protein
MAKLFFGLILFFLFGISHGIYAQQTAAKPAQTEKDTILPVTAKRNPAIRDTAAYVELLVSKTVSEADLQILLVDFNEEAAQVKEKRFELALLEQTMKNIETVPADKLPKLTSAVGKLLVRRIEAEARLKTLIGAYAEQHPLVQKGRIRVQVFGDAIKKLLQ